MSSTVIVILGVIVVAVILLMIMAVGRSRGVRRPQLTPLSPEARDRYAVQWDRVEARFVEAPEEAVREADSILMGLLRERSHPMVERQLPAGMRKARRLAVGEEGKGGTEGMRQAMLQYRAVMEEYGRPVDEPKRVRDERERPEIAS
jgi:hypothetical protein